MNVKVFLAFRATERLEALHLANTKTRNILSFSGLTTAREDRTDSWGPAGTSEYF